MLSMFCSNLNWSELNYYEEQVPLLTTPTVFPTSWVQRRQRCSLIDSHNKEMTLETNELRRDNYSRTFAPDPTIL